jgi:predicted phage-related endonuclease
MRHLQLVQGTDAWLKARLERFTASEAAAMFGVHKNISRTQLLDHKKGWTTEVDSFTQSLFDKGHATEEMARPLAEEVAGEDFAAVVGELEDTMFLASFDGMSMLGDVLFEHKLYNKVLAENVRNNTLEPHYYWQLEHQLLVSGAEKVLFVTSDGTKENWADMYYVSIPSRRAELIAGWEQFAKDLEDHQPQAKTEKVIAEQPSDLPIISYKMDGLTLKSNLDVFKTSAIALVEKSSSVIETDQDFANAESRQKIFTKAEKDIDGLCDRVLGEVADIDSFVKDLRFIKDQIRTARLAEGKQVKERKEVIRTNIAQKANSDLWAYSESTFKDLKVICPTLNVDIVNSMKGKKTVDSLQDAADTELAKGKIEIDALAAIVNANLETSKELATDYKFLFSDWKDIAFKANDDFTFLVKTRIAEHKQVEADKLEAQRAQIRREEEAKAQAKVDAEKAEAERLENEKQATLKAEQDRLREEANAVSLECAQQSKVPVEPEEADATREMQQASSTTSFMKPLKKPIPAIEHDPIAEAFFRGFMTGYTQQESLINPELEAGKLAKQYSNDKAAA